MTGGCFESPHPSTKLQPYVTAGRLGTESFPLTLPPPCLPQVQLKRFCSGSNFFRALFRVLIRTYWTTEKAPRGSYNSVTTSGILLRNPQVSWMERKRKQIATVVVEDQHHRLSFRRKARRTNSKNKKKTRQSTQVPPPSTTPRLHPLFSRDTRNKNSDNAT